ncbi:MAG: hypothetical protein AMXMBFR33_11500 [Candidatus Xenobia bacterium]
MDRELTALRLKRLVGKPPAFLWRRFWLELGARWEELQVAWGWKRFELGPEAWDQARQRPWPLAHLADEPGFLERAEEAREQRVDLLGSGPLSLRPVDWHRDYRSGYVWPRRHIRRLQAARTGAEVKFPWELSRHQWLLPLGQAYRATGEERYAQAARELLSGWIAHNPYAVGVNWAVAMEPALRLVSWTCLFHLLSPSSAWADPAFRSDFLASLNAQAHYVASHLEYSDLNGNHYLAGAVGLIAAGVFFGRPRWKSRGLAILRQELPRQVSRDGVDFEGSVAYHRFVLELFSVGFLLAGEGDGTLAAMLDFYAACLRPDGSLPQLGDNDDGRVLPGFRLLSPAAVGSLGFPDGGYFVMRNQHDHVFIDCAPVGMAGRGGHGHNDCLSFEAILLGCPLIVDSGTGCYTFDPELRNRLRSTAAHNTPQLDDLELNRFVHPRLLWVLRDDARPHLDRFETGRERDLFRGWHTGYPGARPVRTLELEHSSHTLRLVDEVEGRGPRRLSIPLHLHPAVECVRQDQAVRLCCRGQAFELAWSGPGLTLEELPGPGFSPSYGVLEPNRKLVWSGEQLPARLEWSLRPA